MTDDLLVEEPADELLVRLDSEERLNVKSKNIKDLIKNALHLILQICIMLNAVVCELDKSMTRVKWTIDIEHKKNNHRHFEYVNIFVFNGSS